MVCTVPHLLAGLVVDLRGAGQDLQGVVKQALRRRRGRTRRLDLQPFSFTKHGLHDFLFCSDN